MKPDTIAFILVVLAALGTVASSYNYCDPTLCPIGVKHIACNNTGLFNTSCPSDRRLLNITATDIKTILSTHNTYRNRIASGSEAGFLPAARMTTMTWSTELAELAVLKVKECKMLHDACRNTQVFKWAGQNLAYSAASRDFETADVLIKNGIKGWYDEVINAVQWDIENCCTPKSQKTIGHFTQVVTDRAIQVGCAVSQYTEDGWKTSLMCCNYAFTNLIGSKVYISGKSASNCTTGVNPSFTSLCSVNEAVKATLTYN